MYVPNQLHPSYIIIIIEVECDVLMLALALALVLIGSTYHILPRKYVRTVYTRERRHDTHANEPNLLLVTGRKQRWMVDCSALVRILIQ